MGNDPRHIGPTFVLMWGRSYDSQKRAAPRGYWAVLGSLLMPFGKSRK